jgi:hypothetical protein
MRAATTNPDPAVSAATTQTAVVRLHRSAISPRQQRADGEPGITPQPVAYCRGPYCVLAHEAVRALSASGLHAIRLRDGMIEWRLANLPAAV